MQSVLVEKCSEECCNVRQFNRRRGEGSTNWAQLVACKGKTETHLRKTNLLFIYNNWIRHSTFCGSRNLITVFVALFWSQFSVVHIISTGLRSILISSFHYIQGFQTVSPSRLSNQIATCISVLSSIYSDVWQFDTNCIFGVSVSVFIALSLCACR